MVFQLLISTSQKIGLPPALITADKQETIVNDGKITSSSSFRLSDSSARSKATDPFETATAYFAPTKLAILLLNFSTVLP